MEELQLILESLPLGYIYVALAIIVLTFAKILKEFLTPYKISEELTEKDNPALGLSITGYYMAVIILYIGVVYHPTEVALPLESDVTLLIRDLSITLFYSILGIVLLNIAHLITDKFLLFKFSTKKEIIEDRNVGTGVVEFATYIAAGLVIAGALNGDSGGKWWFGIITSIAFFIFGQIVLMLFVLFYQKITSYDIHEQIEQDNVAAGVALAGNMIAISIIILKSLSGNFEGWLVTIINLVIWTVIGFLTLLFFRWVTDLLFLPNATITEEIVQDKNVNAAYMESAILIGVSLIIFLIF